MYRMPFDDGLGAEVVVEIAGEGVETAGLGTGLASAANWLEAAGAAAAAVVVAVAPCIDDGRNIRCGQLQ